MKDLRGKSEVAERRDSVKRPIQNGSVVIEDYVGGLFEEKKALASVIRIFVLDVPRIATITGIRFERLAGDNQ